MALKDVGFKANAGVHEDIKNALRPIATSAFTAIPVGIVVLADAPEFIAGVAIVAIGLAILWAVTLFFVKSREVLGGIWIVGRSIVAGLDRIESWVHSLFNWLDDAARSGIHDIEYAMYNLGHNVYDTFARNDQARISNLEGALASANNRISQLEGSLSAAVMTLNKTITDNVNALGSRIDALSSKEIGDINAANKRITDLATLEATDVKTIDGALVTEADTRSKADTTLQNEINAINYYIDSTINPAIKAAQAEESTLSSELATEQTVIGEQASSISQLTAITTTQEQQITTEETQIESIPAPVTVIETTVTSALDWTAAQIATLTELANDPCMCLSPIGGPDVLYALVGALELGVL